MAASMLDASILAGFLIPASLFIAWYRSRSPLLDPIPTMGFSDPILSFLSAFRYEVFDGEPLLKEGYEKFKPGLFKIPTFRRWIVLPTSAELMEDVRKAPDHTLSVEEPFREFLQTDFTLDYPNKQDSYHRDVVRSKLTRNIAATFEQSHDELQIVLNECIPVTSSEWVKVSIVPTMKRIFCCTSARIFVGIPLCRNRDYQKLLLDFMVDFIKSAVIISMFPRPLKPIAAQLFSNTPYHIRRTMEFIRPIVEERLAKMEEFGDTWDGAPDDMLMWLMSEAKGVERSLEGLARRLLIVSFSGIDTTAFTTTQVLYRLLSNPEYIEPLRKEVEAAVAEEGWTKSGMDKMHKLDSFIRETQRLDGLGIVMSVRLTLRAFTFSNGVNIPPGTFIGFPHSAIQSSEEIYTNPEKFDGFRFEKLRDEEGDVTSTRHRAVTASTEMMAFGLGRHVCPGRFFAINGIKGLLAHIIVTYDVKFEEGKGAPPQRVLSLLRGPRDTDLLFRKRGK